MDFAEYCYPQHVTDMKDTEEKLSLFYKKHGSANGRRLHTAWTTGGHRLEHTSTSGRHSADTVRRTPAILGLSGTPSLIGSRRAYTEGAAEGATDGAALGYGRSCRHAIPIMWCCYLLMWLRYVGLSGRRDKRNREKAAGGPQETDARTGPRGHTEFSVPTARIDAEGVLILGS